MPDDPCTCTGPGFCPRFQMGQTRYAVEICQDKHGAEKGKAYRRKWSGKTGTTTERKPAKTLAVVPPVTRPVKTISPPVPGISVRVQKRGCRAKCKWGWVVLLDGVSRESGDAETKEEAEKAAHTEASQLAAFMGLPFPA